MQPGLFVSLECTLSMAAPLAWAVYELLTLNRPKPPKPPRWTVPIAPLAPAPVAERVLEDA